MGCKVIKFFFKAMFISYFSSAVYAGPLLDTGAFGFGFNINNSSYSFPLYTSVDSRIELGGFDQTTGLGFISATFEGIGDYSFDAIFDHEIIETANTYFNEQGFTNNLLSLAAGQSWEIDDPVNGDIIGGFTIPKGSGNFDQSSLDNSIGSQVNANGDDISMAMGWDFSLGMDEKAIISYVLTDSAPTSGFYLTQYDPDSDYSIYLSSSLNISAIPEPSILLLFGVGLVGLAFGSRRRSS